MNKLAIYEQLAEQIRHEIAAGIIRPGDKLPSVRKFALEKQINPNTAVKVYKTLENEGVITSIPSKGNFVSDDADQLQSLRVAELMETCRALLEKMRGSQIKASAILKLVEGVYHDFER
ncbi:GntR family transcriptional regulator [Bacilli bacterium]|nr:GntR family transcriptional regulator [Bacilli bacterium]